MTSVRRFTALLVIAGAVGLGPAGAAVVCPSGATSQGCCCGPDSCSCPVQPTLERSAQACGCGSSTPIPATPQAAGPTLSGPGTELAAVSGRIPAALADSASLRAHRDGPHCGRTPSGPLIYLIECALLI